MNLPVSAQSKLTRMLPLENDFLVSNTVPFSKKWMENQSKQHSLST